MLIIDADAHVLERPDVFTSRAVELRRQGDVEFREDVKQDFWFVGDVPIQTALGTVMVPDADGRTKARRELRAGDGVEWRSPLVDPPLVL